MLLWQSAIRKIHRRVLLENNILKYRGFEGSNNIVFFSNKQRFFFFKKT